MNFICDKFDLRTDIQFNTRIQSAQFLDDQRTWQVTDTSGRVYTSRYLITGMGVLSNPTLPNVPGVKDFQGEAFHTARWPKEPVSFENKRVGIIGTGATAIQAIPEIAKTVGHLTVFVSLMDIIPIAGTPRDFCLRLVLICPSIFAATDPQLGYPAPQR